MAAILTAAEMRALERAAIDSGEVTGLELMERAGRGVVEAILAEWPRIEEGARRAVVLCGPGNNGGDGFVVARLLKERGWGVMAYLYGEASKLPPDARNNHDRLADLGSVRPLGDLPRDARSYAFATAPRLVVDALFGTGLTRPLAAEIAQAVEAINLNTLDIDGGRPLVVAVDVPSGLDADTGNHVPFEPGPMTKPLWVVSHTGLVDPSTYPAQPRIYDPIWAHLTVTFHSLKPGHLLGEGPSLCNKVVAADIGLFDPTQWTRVQHVGKPEHGWHNRLLKGAGHKFTHGHAFILSGGASRGGAARLSARGALRIGAGLVTLAVPPAALQENAARLDAIMLKSIRDPEALTDLLSDDRVNALCAGPGFGTGERQAAMLAVLLDASRGAGGADLAAKPRHVVLDADALTLLSKDPALRAKLHESCVLTPHEGEFARLFPAIDARWRAPATTGPAVSKVDAAREAAKEAGCVVLLKGPDTVIADPTGRAAINAAVYDRAAPWLATAGSGDVLAGFIAGLLARGLPPFDAACTAAWLHVECARSFGPGLIAEDLPEELPKVFRALGL